MSLKRLVREVERREAGVVVLGGCLGCGEDLALGAPSVRTERAVRCHACGRETALTILNRGTAGVRLPYGCAGWFDVTSSNLAAVGRLRADLLVRFKRGGVYRYPGAGAKLAELLRAASAGKFLNARVKPRFDGVLLCAVYGCVGAAERATQQVLCERHLSHKS